MSSCIIRLISFWINIFHSSSQKRLASNQVSLLTTSSDPTGIWENHLRRVPRSPKLLSLHSLLGFSSTSAAFTAPRPESVSKATRDSAAVQTRCCFVLWTWMCVFFYGIPAFLAVLPFYLLHFYGFRLPVFLATDPSPGWERWMWCNCANPSVFTALYFFHAVTLIFIGL